MVNVFSFCLYGPFNDRYYTGMQQNVLLALKHFPSWKVYVYIAPDVEPDMIQWLRGYHTVVLRETGVVGAINMIHRFYAIDEPEIDIMMVRDADSRIHWKDRWAIQEFVANERFVAHTIRDNVMHTAHMMGGLWGLRKASGLNIHKEYASYKEDESLGHRLAHDQNFLTDVVYPKVKEKLLVHYSNGRKMPGEYAVEFPFEWTNDIYCGRIETGFIDRSAPRLGFSLPQVPTRIR
jgi:hypothetical protein